MAKTDLRVTIDADAAKLEREVRRAQSSMERLSREIAKGNREADRFAAELNQRTAQALQNVGRGMVMFGAATVAGLGLAAREAIKWESAWAGVRKTVEGSPEELAAVEQGLRDLATTLPATHGEIAAVAEAAGQLGVATPDIVGFTRVMVDLGETTNLTADEAATAIAQLMNVMQTAPQDVGRLGAALVELGNNGASTERDIIEMAQRIAGAGAIVGMSEADVLGFANALASVGIEAQAGGTAISRVMVDIANAVADGGESVEGFARVAGMSAQEFAEAFERDPARAIQAFVSGLGEINTAGGNVFATLEDLGFSEIRVRDALLRMAGAGDLLSQSLDDGNRAWSENTALIEEAEKRYDTAEAKIGVARNTLVDLAIDVGGVLLPAIAGLAEGAADLLKWFGDLPGPVKTVATVLAGMVGTLSLLGGGFLLLAPRVAAARTELQLLAVTAPRVATAMRLFTLSIPVVGALLAVAAGIAAIAASSEDAAPPISDATKALLDLADGVRSDLIQGTVDAAAAMQRLGEQANEALVPEGAIAAADELNRVSGEFERNISAMDTALSEMVAGGNADAAKVSFNALADALGEQGIGVAELRDMLPGYVEALAQAENQNRLVAESVDPAENRLAELAAQFGLTGDDAADAAQSMLDSWVEASTSFVGILGAYEAVLASKEEKEREAAQATADATEDASDSWEDYVADVAVSVDEYLDELERQVKAQQDWQTNMLILAGKVSSGTLDELAKLGPEGAPLVAELVDASDDELARLETVFGQRSEAAGAEFADRLADAGPVLVSIAREHGQDVADSIARGMAQNGSSVEAEARRQGVRIDRGVGTNRTRRPPIQPRLQGANIVERAINNLARPRRMTINVGYAVTGSGLPAGLTRGHSGGVPRFHDGGVPRFHSGGGFGLGHDEGLAILQSRERVLSREQNRAFEQFVRSFSTAVPVSASSSARGDGVTWRITGDGPLYEQIAYGVRTGQLRLEANGARVKVG